MLYDDAGRQIGAVTLRNVSDTGAQIEMTTEAELPARFQIAFARSGSVRRKCEKVWQTGAVAGVRFLVDRRP